MPSDAEPVAEYRLKEKDQADDQAGLDGAAQKPLKERVQGGKSRR